MNANISSVMFVIRFDASPLTALRALPPSTPVLVIDWHDSPWRIMTATEAIATRRHYADCGELKTAVVAYNRTEDFNANWRCLIDNDTAGYHLLNSGRWDYIYPNNILSWEDIQEWDNNSY